MKETNNCGCVEIGNPYPKYCAEHLKQNTNMSNLEERFNKEFSTKDGFVGTGITRSEQVIAFIKAEKELSRQEGYEAGRKAYAERATPVLEIIAREEGRQEAYKEIVEMARKMIIRNNPKQYDGDDLREAEGFYGIAAEGWAEIIRYEDGHDLALATLIRNITPPKNNEHE